MLTVFLLVFSLSRATTPAHPAADDGPPTLIVQVVDPVLIPLPASDVTVKPASGKGSSKSSHVDENGFAKFWLEPSTKYVIEAKSPGFNSKSQKVSIGQPKAAKPTAHVQIKLKPNEGAFAK